MSKIKGTIKAKKTRKAIPNLETTPNHICFKNYEEGQVIKELIEITNHDMKSYHLSIEFDNTDELKLSVIGNVTKTFLDFNETLVMELEFTPRASFKKESVDNRYDICVNIVNANANWHIPVLILSSNPIVNFPKEIQFPDVALNTPVYSNIFVLNYTNHFYKFSFECRNEVKILPDCKVMALKPCDGSIYRVELIPKLLGAFREKIHICFDGGKRIAIMLKCNVVPLNIFLSDEIVEFTPTFLGMMDTKSINIINNGEEMTLFELVPIECLHKNQDEANHDSKKFLQFSPQNGELQPNSITKVYVTFKPEDQKEDDDDPEKDLISEISFNFALKLSFDINYHPTFQIQGKILGPTFQLDRRHIDIDTLYLGEYRYLDVTVINAGVIGGRVYFHKTPSPTDGIIKISSKSEFIDVGESKGFKLKFLAKRVGKFIEQAFFKVKSGERLTLAIEGIVKPLEVYFHPRTIEFPSSAMCVPQLQTLLIKNELPFDVNVNIEIESDGSDNPMEFIEFFKSQITAVVDDESAAVESSNILSSSSFSSSSSSSSHLTRTSIKNFMEQCGKLEHLRDLTSDGIATIFKRVDDMVASKEIAASIIQNLFEVVDCEGNEGRFKYEIEKRFIAEMMVEVIMEKVREADYAEIGFERFNKKDWKLPENPRQVEVNKKCFCIASKEDIELKIFFTPNFIGKFTKNLKLFLEMATGNSNIVDKTVIKIPIISLCPPPQLKIHDETKQIECYAENEVQCEVLVENVTNVDSFFSLEHFSDDEMEIHCEDEKFHLPPTSTRVVKLIITPRKSGEILKNVHIIALGSNKKFPIYIDCKSLPPDVVIKPGRICEELEVLVKHDTRIFIENRSTTKARFFAKLEHDSECFNINPSGSIMSGNQCVMVMLEKFFYDPADYRDVLVIEVVNSKVFRIPIRCIAKKLPILIEPSFAPVIDFGSLFVSRTPYFLDYQFTNAGKRSYMLFIILKNWRNRSQEIRYTIEPNRFELASNESRVVKILLNVAPEHGVSMMCEEEFTVEGCSSQFPLREIIWESRLKANVIKPAINFSRSELIFNCYYGRHEEEDLCEIIEIINKSSLPLPITLKIEGEFFTNENQSLKFELSVKESRQIPIKFPSRLLTTTNIFCTFLGKLKAYALGRLQCTMNLVGNLIYPEIEFSSREIHVVNDMLPCAFTLNIRNPSDVLMSLFKLKFKENSTLITPIEEKRQSSLMNIVQCLMKRRTNLREKFFLPDYCNEEYYNVKVDDADIEDDEHIERKSKKLKSQTVVDDDDDGERKSSGEKYLHEIIAKNYEIEATSKDVQKCFKSLMRSISETQLNDRNNEGMFKIKSSSLSQGNCECQQSYLSLSQSEGTLKEGESRLISIHFGGSRSAFTLTTTLVCETIGGTTQEIPITLTNCNPNILLTKTYFQLSQSWHEISANNVTVSSVCPSSINIKLIGAEKSDVEVEELMAGYVKHSNKSPLDFVLDNERNFCGNLKFSIFCGCQPIFRNEFGIQVNDKPPIPVTFFAPRNTMPTATLLDIDRSSLNDIQKPFEYDCMREMFRQIVDHIRIHESEMSADEMLKAKAVKLVAETSEAKVRRKSTKRDKKKTGIDSMSAGDSETSPKEFGLFYGENGRVVWRERANNLSAKMLQFLDKELAEGDFVVIDYPPEYPHSTEITHFIAQQGFVQSLITDEEIFNSYKNLYNCHVVEKFRQAKRTHMPVIEDSVVTPLPLIVQAYTLDIGTLEIGEEFEKIIEIYFHGERLMAAVRSEIKIPDFQVQFLQRTEINGCSITNYEINNFCKYRNRHERKFLENQLSPQFAVKRCHSFDFTTGKVHGRIIDTDRNEINRIYNEKMATRVKPEERSAIILSEIIQQPKSQPLTQSRFVEIKIKFQPTIENYDDETNFDEIIYVDLHLGPQIPLHITGKITHATN